MSRRPTIKDVARTAGVSTVTVSRAVNTPGLVQAETRARIAAAMRELGYLPNLAARAMRTHHTRTIGCIVPDLTNYANAAVAQAAERRLAEADHCLLLVSSNYRPEQEVRALEVLRTRQVDGIVLYVSDERDQSLIEAVRRLDVPCVVLDRDLPVLTDTILSDHAAAMTEVVEHLLRLGHRRLGLLALDLRVRPVVERCRTFLAAVAAAGLDPAAQTLRQVPVHALDQLEPLRLLPDEPGRPTAVIVEGRRLLLGVIQAARTSGWRIPQDLSVVGIDAADIAEAAVPEITCIVRDFAAMGRAAAEAILRRVGADPGSPPGPVVLPSAVVHKESCGPPPVPGGG